MDDLAINELLIFYCDILARLRQRGILRTSNLVGDYAEWLVSTKLGLTLCPNSNRGYDAVDSQGMRYQIKGRRLTSANKSTQLSDLHGLTLKQFDYLIAVVFDERFSILYAGQLSHEVVSLRAKQKTPDKSVMLFPSSLLRVAGVIDLTDQLSGVEKMGEEG